MQSSFRNVWCNKNFAFPIANSKSYRPQESDNRVLHLDIYDHTVRTKNVILYSVLLFCRILELYLKLVESFTNNILNRSFFLLILEVNKASSVPRCRRYFAFFNNNYVCFVIGTTTAAVGYFIPYNLLYNLMIHKGQTREHSSMALSLVGVGGIISRVLVGLVGDFKCCHRIYYFIFAVILSAFTSAACVHLVIFWQYFLCGFLHGMATGKLYLSRGTAFPTRLYVRPAKTQISMRICTCCSESSLSSRRHFRSFTSHRMLCEDSDQSAHVDLFTSEAPAVL